MGLLQEYTPHLGPLDQVRKGVLVCMADGAATAYALSDLAARGTMFVKDGDAVYPSMIVGESATDDDLHVRSAAHYHRYRLLVLMKCALAFGHQVPALQQLSSSPLCMCVTAETRPSAARRSG